MPARAFIYPLSLALLAALLAAGHGQGHRETTDKTTETNKAAKDALAGVNESARAAYRAARERILSRTGPVVLLSGDTLVFRYGDLRTVSKPTPALYHDLKTVGHVALGLYSLLYPPERSVSDSR